MIGLLAYKQRISANDIELIFFAMDAADLTLLNSPFLTACAAACGNLTFEGWDLQAVAHNLPHTISQGATFPIYVGDTEPIGDYTNFTADQVYTLVSLAFSPIALNVPDWGDTWPLESSIWRSIAVRYMHTPASIPACPSTHDDQSTPELAIYTPKITSRGQAEFTVASDFEQALNMNNAYLSGFQYLWAGQELPYWHILLQTGFTPIMQYGQIQLFKEWHDGHLGGITEPNPGLGFQMFTRSLIIGGIYTFVKRIDSVGSYSTNYPVQVYPKPAKKLVSIIPMLAGLLPLVMLAAAGASQGISAGRRRRQP